MPNPSAHIQDAINSGVALKASAAWKTIATELVKPTSTATKPAVKAEGLRSLKNCMARIVARNVARKQILTFAGGDAIAAFAINENRAENRIHRSATLQ